MAYATTISRRRAREVRVGDVTVGGEHPIAVQSMTTPDTHNLEAVSRQIAELEEAGCELIRVTVPKKQDLEALPHIKERMRRPLICDIHFDYRMALGCLDARTCDGRPACDKIRINPGNIGGRERYLEVVRKAKDRGIPMRIGVNAGSLEKDLLDKYGFPCPEALVESALRHIEDAESVGYRDIIVSLKSSHVPTAVESYRLFSEKCDYPTHVGITEAGAYPYGAIKSAAGLGAILLMGIGDTVRVSLLVPDKRKEVETAFDILQATGRRVRKPEVIACPTCGRLEIDLQRIVAEVQERLRGRTMPVQISILGCIVNGIGEAKEADLGIAAGRGKGVIFRRGEIVRHVSEAEMVDALIEELEQWEAGVAAPASTASAPKDSRILPVV